MDKPSTTSAPKKPGTGFFMPRTLPTSGSKQPGTMNRHRQSTAGDGWGRSRFSSSTSRRSSSPHSSNNTHSVDAAGGSAGKWSSSPASSNRVSNCSNSSECEAWSVGDLTCPSSEASFPPGLMGGTPYAAAPAAQCSSGLFALPLSQGPQISTGGSHAAPLPPSSAGIAVTALGGDGGASGAPGGATGSSSPAVLSEQELLLLQQQEADLDAAICNLMSMKQQLAAKQVQAAASAASSASGQHTSQAPVATSAPAGSIPQPQPQQQQHVYVLLPASMAQTAVGQPLSCAMATVVPQQQFQQGPSSTPQLVNLNGQLSIPAGITPVYAAAPQALQAVILQPQQHQMIFTEQQQFLQPVPPATTAYY